MKIRKYEGPNEKEAMLKVKEELGSDALIVSVKNIRPKGIYKLFRKPYVEVTAALDDRSVLEETPLAKARVKERTVDKEAVVMEKKDPSQEEQQAYFERFKMLVENMPDHFARDSKEAEEPNQVGHQDNEAVEDPEDDSFKDGALLEAVYEQLMDNEVSEKIVNELTQGVLSMQGEDDEDLTDVISVIYKRIIKLLSDVKTIDEKASGRIFFVGPTGVGKTTTIAKVASYYTLNLGKKVALITSDTYRIAAVEQLRTYANILGIPIKVVYSPDELAAAVEQFEDKDLILIDTAGRSHKNSEHQHELKELIEAVPSREIYLVLSVATKYRDLHQITKVYDEIGDYKLLFTKLDETSAYGNILNMKVETGATLSYVTFGQNVPDDISDLNPHEIARAVMGGNA